MRRHFLLGLTGLALAACVSEPGGSYLGGVGDPVRGAALQAPWTFGATPFSNEPAKAAQAAQQLEFLTDAFQNDPRYAPTISPQAVNALLRAQAEMRQFLGIPASAPAQPVIAALNEAAGALQNGNRTLALAALTTDFFTAGPEGTLSRLNNMPRMNNASVAAGMASQAINQMDSGPDTGFRRR